MRTKIRVRRFSIEAKVYDWRTKQWYNETYLASGRISMWTAERDLKRWAWGQGLIVRVVSAEDISDEPLRIEMDRPSA